MSEKLWLEPGLGFSVEWNGWSRSYEKRASGRYYAKCKTCGLVIDARLPQMRKHNNICTPFAEDDAATEEAVKHITEDDHIYYDPLNQDEDSHEDHSYRELVIKKDRPAKNKKRSAGQSESQFSPKVAKKSRFSDVARVWERKLEELPLDQALQIEKNMNDMLYEANMACLQHHPGIVQVTIGTTEQIDERFIMGIVFYQGASKRVTTPS